MNSDFDLEQDMYKALHPKDNDVTEDKLMILVEAQTTWTMKIIVRGLMYMVQTWHEYFGRTKQNLYKSKKGEAANS